MDALNFGVTGYTFSQEYVTLRDHVFKYDPQVVVLLLQPFNYLKNTRDLYPGDTHDVPFYVLENGGLVPDRITANRTFTSCEQQATSRKIDARYTRDFVRSGASVPTHVPILLLVASCAQQVGGGVEGKMYLVIPKTPMLITRITNFGRTER